MEEFLQPRPPAQRIGLPKPRRLCQNHGATRTSPPNLTFQLAPKGCPDQGRNENDPDDWHNLAADPKPEHEQVMAGLRKWFPAREAPQVADMLSSREQEQRGG